MVKMAVISFLGEREPLADTRCKAEDLEEKDGREQEHWLNLEDEVWRKAVWEWWEHKEAEFSS